MISDHNHCKFCNRPVDLDQSGWRIHWDKKNRGGPADRVWFECPDHTYEQLQLGEGL